MRSANNGVPLRTDHMMTHCLAGSLALVALLVMGWLIYKPGLAGGFLFDDFANLPALGETGPIDNPAALARYMTSGTADPSGRPVALASFLLDAQDWPAPPRPFKRTNVLLHLLNGSLLLLALYALGRRAVPKASPGRIFVAAWLGSAMWLLHPLLVSTTLYIVQREAMLPATFTLLGILAWSKMDQELRKDRLPLAVAYATVSLILCTALAGLSKLNGVLLPTLLLVLDRTVLANDHRDLGGKALRIRRNLLGACWGITLAVIITLIYVAVISTVRGLPHRPWTELQRLLTEPRILWQYLSQLWMPHPYTAGVFNDAIVVSKDLTSPLTTVPATVGVLFTVTAAIYWRARWPFVACAVLFFFAGHLLESTTVPLELYFEHRNYLPAMLLFWPVGIWLSGALAGATDRNPFPSVPFRYALAIMIVSGLALMTRANAEVWGDTSHQATLWARLNPMSARAQVSAAQEEIQNGVPEKAVARLAPVLREHPEEVQVAFNLVAAHCALGDLTAEDLEAAGRAISTTIDPGALLVSWFDRTIPEVSNGNCKGLDFAALADLAHAGLSNPRLPPGRRQDLEHALGSIALARNRPDEALAHFDKALAFDPREAVALRQAAELGSAGYATYGLKHLATFSRISERTEKPAPGMSALHAWVLAEQGYWPRERARLEANLHADSEPSQ